jgi:acetoin utilization deacetylase AcuC-like enzyme
VALLGLFGRFLGKPRVGIVFDDRYAQAVPGVPMDPSRGVNILAYLLANRMVRPRDVAHPLPPRLGHVLAVHTEPYLESIEDAAVLSTIFGVPIGGAEVGPMLDWQHLAVGGTIQAARIALAARGCAANLSGGFHHAYPERGMGFCVLNDVAIAIRRLQRKGFRKRILVVDLDLHHGNGTRAVFAKDESVHTFSIHNAAWDDTPAVASTDLALGPGVGDQRYLDALQQALPPVLTAHRPGLVFYVAGTDPARDDALGDWEVSAAGMLARDRFVVDQVRAIVGPRTPLVIVLGGGYGHVSWRYSARFFGWLVLGRVVEPPDEMELTVQRYRAAVHGIDRDQARHGGADEWRLTEEDVLLTGPGAGRETRILGRYTLHGLELLLGKVGILQRLRALGYRKPTLEADFGSGLGQTVRVYGAPARGQLLMELRMRRDRRTVPECELLFLEWLLLQNPRASFSPRLPPLPGQQHPGLGLLGVVMGLLVLIAEQLGLDGVVDVPSNYFVAAVGRKHLRFLDPMAQAVFEALVEQFRGLPLVEAERLLDGRVVNVATGHILRWAPSPMVIPVSGRLVELVKGEAYEAARRAARSGIELKVLGRPDARPRTARSP